MTEYQTNEKSQRNSKQRKITSFQEFISRQNHHVAKVQKKLNDQVFAILDRVHE
jgi:hypothetical protein